MPIVGSRWAHLGGVHATPWAPTGHVEGSLRAVHIQARSVQPWCQRHVRRTCQKHSIRFMTPSTPSAQEAVYQHLLNGIRMGHLQPGQRLVAEDIANALHMSRMPVREALRRLSAQGLIQLHTHRGAVVKRLTRSEVEEIFEMRAVLEALAASMAVRKATAADIDQLEGMLLRLQEVQADLPQWITLHREFHERICALSQAPRLLAQITALHVLIEPLMRIWIERAPGAKNVHDVHAQILAVMRSGDTEAMELLIKRHSRVTAQVIVESMFSALCPTDDSGTKVTTTARRLRTKSVQPSN